MPSILEDQNTSAPSVFLPAALLREARRQKGMAPASVLPACILDPDGVLVGRFRQTGAAKRFDGWPCYHTELHLSLGAHQVGIGGRVGASFACPPAFPLGFVAAKLFGGFLKSFPLIVRRSRSDSVRIYRRFRRKRRPRHGENRCRVSGVCR